MLSSVGVRAHDYPKNTPAQLAATIAADGWQGVQLALPKAIVGVEDFFNTPEPLLAEIKTSFAAAGLTLSVLGSYVELGLVDEAQRAGEVAKFLSQLKVAKALGAHCIASETTCRAKQPEASQKDALAALYRSLCEILPMAQALSMEVAIEPVQDHTLSTAALAKAMIKDLASPRLKLVLDPGNLLPVALYAFQDRFWQESVALLGESIAVLHCKGQRRGVNGIEPCPLSQSEIALPQVMALLNDLPQPIPALREEAVPALAKEESAYLKQLAGL